jgi:putative transposase
VKYAWISEHCNDYPVSLMCRVLEVSASGFYDWLNRKPSAQQQRRDKIARAANEFYFQSHRIYGYRKVWQDLLEAGIICCDETVRRIMSELGLYSRIKRKFVVTTDSDHHEPVAANVLERDFNASEPNQKWVADITYIPTQEGWLYLAAVMDLYSRRIIGWSMSDRIDTALVKSALDMATFERRPDGGLMHHSDRGVQYASGDYQQKLKDLDIVCSMSGKGDCWDNAAMESFFGSLKTEWVYGKIYVNRKTAENDLFNYIEVFYNRKRRHASLDYVNPVAFEKRYEADQDQAA